MAITIFEHPNGAHPSLLEQPIRFKLRTDNLMAHNGSLSEYQYMIYESFPTDGKVLRIHFLEYELEFTCADNPDLANNEISNSIDGDPDEGELWANTVAAELNQNPIIAEHWTVTGNGGTIDTALLLFTAKYKSGALTMPIYINTTGSGYIKEMQVDAYPGQQPKRKDSFYIVTDIYDHNGDKIDRKTLVPDDNGDVDFDLAPVLKPIIPREIYLDNSVVSTDYATKFFNLKFWERWSSENSSPIQSSSTYYYMHGGISHLHQGLMNDYYTDWFEELEVTKQLFTDRPLISYASEDQYLVFGFFAQEPYYNVELELKAYVKDQIMPWYGTYYQTVGNIYNFTIKRINISAIIQQWLGGWSPLKMERIEFRLTNTGMPTYTIRLLENLKHGTEFIYRNSWGQYDSIILKGLEKEKHDYKGNKDIRHYLPANYNTTDRSYSQQRANRREQIEAHSGLMNKEEVNMLKSLLLSDDAFVVKNRIKIPITIDRQSVQIINKVNDQEDIKFNYKHAHSDHINTNYLTLNI